MSVRMDDHSGEILQAASRAALAAMTAVGLQAVGNIKQQMISGYDVPHGDDGHTAIRDTSALINDVQYEANENQVQVGNSLDYALFVHDGTQRLGARPYITDAVMGNTDKYRGIIKQAFENA